jgi:hypothetical protein
MGDKNNINNHTTDTVMSYKMSRDYVKKLSSYRRQTTTKLLALLHDPVNLTDAAYFSKL